MMQILTKKEHKEHQRKLIKFCKDNYCLMYNYMNTIQQIRDDVKRIVPTDEEEKA